MSSCSPFVRLFTTTAQNNKLIQGILSDMSVAKACELLNSRKLTYSEVENHERCIIIGGSSSILVCEAG